MSKNFECDFVFTTQSYDFFLIPARVVAKYVPFCRQVVKTQKWIKYYAKRM